jgi:hypothetical protein
MVGAPPKLNKQRLQPMGMRVERHYYTHREYSKIPVMDKKRSALSTYFKKMAALATEARMKKISSAERKRIALAAINARWEKHRAKLKQKAKSKRRKPNAKTKRTRRPRL